MTPTDQTLLLLLRAATGSPLSQDSCLSDRRFSEVDWKLLFRHSRIHGVEAIAVDGLQRILSEYPDLDLHFPADRDSVIRRQKWLAHSVTVERSYARHVKALTELASLYSTHGIRTMVLKGYGLSLDYPVPAHRRSADIDTYHFGSYREADALLSGKLGIPVGTGQHHHTIFFYDGIQVENHYDFINVHAHRDAAVIEARLKQLADASTDTVEVSGQKIWLPSPDFNSIFLIRHLGQHFGGEGVNLRQILDWALFMKNHSADVDWSSVTPFLKQVGLWEFFCLVNTLCVRYLDLPASSFPALSDGQALVQRIMEDILSLRFIGNEPEPFLQRWLYRIRRWWTNRWKHRLVYNDSLLGTALSLAWSHIRKPVINPND